MGCDFPIKVLRNSILQREGVEMEQGGSALPLFSNAKATCEMESAT